MSAAAPSLLDTLRNARLLNARQLAAVEQALAKGAAPQAVTARLVEQQVLTRWQADQLLAGRQTFLLGGKYLLKDQIGEGGMGAVYRAYHQATQRDVALKCMSPRLVREGDAVARFLREMQAASALSHPNIVKAYDAGQEGEQYFLVMEYVPGKDLWSWLQEHGPLPIDWACECIRQAALGLQHAHEQGLIHRDIKPSNLLVVGDLAGAPKVKVLDLGLARFMNSPGKQDRLTQSHEIMGTPDYMAPEQGTSSKNVDIRADIYSLGCTLFTLLAGREPFEGDTSVEKLVARSLHDAPPVSQFRPDTPAALTVVIAKMLERSPDARYQTPGEVARALRPFSLGGAAEGDTAIAIDTHVRLPPVPAADRPSDFKFHLAAPAAPGTDQAPQGAAGMGAKLWWIAGGGAVAAVLAIGWLALSGDPAPTPSKAANKPALAKLPATKTPATKNAATKLHSETAAAFDLADGVKLDVVLVPAGDFLMGSNDGAGNERPVHRVTISKPYYIGKYEVTVRQWRAFADATKFQTEAERMNSGNSVKDGRFQEVPGASWKTPGFPQDDTHPVCLVSWNDAQEFCKWASQQTGRTVRLPTEAEWEYAARGPKNSVYPWGDAWSSAPLLANVADASLKGSGFAMNFGGVGESDGFAQSAPAGSFKNGASWCGALDMAGNQWEWCQDFWSDGYGSAAPVVDPTGATGGLGRVLRGACWISPSQHCRSAWRANPCPQNMRHADFGFRIVAAP